MGYNANLIRQANARSSQRVTFVLFLVGSTSLFAIASNAYAAPSFAADFNGDGLVSHADYSILGNNFGTVSFMGDADSDGLVGSSDYAIYLAEYGQTASTPSANTFTIVPTPTLDGNVLWTFQFTNITGALAGHFSLRVEGPSAPNILSMSEGDQFKDLGGASVGVPGPKTFTWLTTTDVDGSPAVNNWPIGTQFDNSTHEAYAALGSSLGTLFAGESPTVFTLVTEGQSETTIRLLTGSSAAGRYSEYGYNGIDYYFLEDQVVTFTPAVPEPGTALVIGGALLAAGLVRRRR